jgi:hypothetical protein
MDTDTDDRAEQELALLGDVLDDVSRRSARWAELDAELQAIRRLRSPEAVRRLNRLRLRRVAEADQDAARAAELAERAEALGMGELATALRGG